MSTVLLRCRNISCFRRLSVTPIRPAPVGSSKLFEKALDKVISVMIINPLKRKMKTSPTFKEKIRTASHLHIKLTHRFNFWKVWVDQDVKFSEEAKARSLKKRLSEADRDLDNNLAAVVDLIKEIMNFVSSLFLVLIVVYIWGEKEDPNILINEELDDMESAIRLDKIEHLLNQTESLQSEIIQTLEENQKIRDSIQQIIANVSLSA